MSKEGIPAVYEVSDAAIKNIDRVRHDRKSYQDKLPVSERPRVFAAAERVKAMKGNIEVVGVDDNELADDA